MFADGLYAMKVKTRFIALAVGALAVCASTPSYADMTLVDAATPPCPIIYNERDKSPAVALARENASLFGSKRTHLWNPYNERMTNTDF